MEPTNSFAGRHDDYAFFMAHTDEPAQCRDALLRALSHLPPGPIRWLDFGCGGGEFLASTLPSTQWHPSDITLHLVDVDTVALQSAVPRLAPHAASIADTATIPAAAPFQIVTSNHALYYPDDLAGTLSSLIALVAEGGTAVWTLGGRENQLCRLWLELFQYAGEPLPFFLAEDVAQWLARSGLTYRTEVVPSTLRFPDTAENRDRIARFLFGPRLDRFGLEPVRDTLSAWRLGAEIIMENRDQCFVLAR